MGSSTVRNEDEEEIIDVLVTFEDDFEKSEVEVDRSRGRLARRVHKYNSAAFCRGL